MAVVGSGPAGFYTAYRVMSLIDRAKVDMYEALPVPFGLVRFGVAPDHPEVKVFSVFPFSFSPFVSQILHCLITFEYCILHGLSYEQVGSV